jgi:hypothetical protein
LRVYYFLFVFVILSPSLAPSVRFFVFLLIPILTRTVERIITLIIHASPAMMMQTSLGIILPKLGSKRDPPSKMQKILLAAETQFECPLDAHMSQIILVYADSNIA